MFRLIRAAITKWMAFIGIAVGLWLLYAYALVAAAVSLLFIAAWWGKAHVHKFAHAYSIVGQFLALAVPLLLAGFTIVMFIRAILARPTELAVTKKVLDWPELDEEESSSQPEAKVYDWSNERDKRDREAS